MESDVHAQIDQAAQTVIDRCADDVPKVQQLQHHIKSVHMVIDQLIERAANRAAESE